VAREEGLRGLYKGSSALLLREGHSFATYFLSYAILSEWLTPAGHIQPGEHPRVGWGLGEELMPHTGT
jgi:solute carrier family 25 protein 45/47